MKNIYLILAAFSLGLLASCGSSGEALIKEDTDLIEALGGAEYAMLTDAERYDAAEYLMRKGDAETARAIYEDIVTHNRRAVTVKYKLAMIYLGKDRIEFLKKTEKGKVEKFYLNGKELGEKVLLEIAEQDPWYLPVYSQLMILEAGKGNIEGVKKWYDKARALDDDYATSDYRVAVLTMTNTSNVDEGKQLLIKGQKSFSDLYQSYKNLGNIQKVQHQDTLALETLDKAAHTKLEAVDLFSIYYDMAYISARLYKARNDEKYKTQAIMYGCISVQYFPHYKPALTLVKELAGIEVPGSDSAAVVTETMLSAYQTAVSEYAKNIIPEKNRIQMSTSEETVIPESILIDQWAEKQKELSKKKPGSSSNKAALYIGGGIVLGAGAAVAGITLIGGKSTKSSFGNPPTFPTPD